MRTLMPVTITTAVPRPALATMAALCSMFIWGVSAQAQPGIYTSPTEWHFKTASCNPHCDHTPGYTEGDGYSFQENTPANITLANPGTITMRAPAMVPI